MAMVKPDYDGGSIVNLMASIVTALGGDERRYSPLVGLDLPDLEASNIVLMVVDGLGYSYLTGPGAGSMLSSLLKGRMTSVFPSTTATAITTFLTGLAPQQHGLTGWHMYFRELGCVGAVLPFRPRYGGASFKAAGIDPEIVFGHIAVFDRVPVACSVVSPQRIVHSDFNLAHSGRATRYGFKSLEHFFAQTEFALRQGEKRKYVYAYYPEIDSLAHQFGVGSSEVATHFAEWDRGFAAFLEAIQGTRTVVIVTADHGFIDKAPGCHIELENHPRLAETLLLPLCGESRAAYCYVREEKIGQFEEYVNTELSDHAVLYHSQQLLEAGWFGPGDAHPALPDRIGNYTLVMKGGSTIKDWIQGEHRYHLIGVHGGVSESEMYVPLIVIKP